MKTTFYLILVLGWITSPLVAVQSTAPVLNSVSPTSTAAGGSSFYLILTGSQFSSSSVVQWNGASLLVTYASATRLWASVPIADIARPGKVNITVYNPGNRGGTSRPLTFTITGACNLQVATPSLPTAIAHNKYSTSLTATGGTARTRGVLPRQVELCRRVCN